MPTPRTLCRKGKNGRILVDLSAKTDRLTQNGFPVSAERQLYTRTRTRGERDERRSAAAENGVRGGPWSRTRRIFIVARLAG